MNTTIVSARTKVFLVGAVAVALVGMSLPAFSHAATYAYVNVNGDVKSVTANDWRTAIDVAPSRHLNSGVLLLDSASDFTIVGDTVSAF